MMCAEVVLLHDSCSAVQVFLEVRRNEKSRAVRKSIAGYVLRALTAEATFSIRYGTRGLPSLLLFRVGKATGIDGACYVALPSRGRFFIDYCLAWGRHAHYGQARQYAARCRMAMLQTVGGGWASLRRADKALMCAIMLYETAARIHDAATLRKCRVFVGWAHLWNGDVRRAVDIFEQQRREAQVEGDAVQERRCISAIHYACHGPSVVVAGGARGHGGFHLSECWTELFA
ncbi:hypothetical protein TraAM80_02017 [Trypanosoma rangeli]|uniref:Uncharacterized protein n=1 Tax=Trypanosoma rangeli TaxID=5698 RepID=A0A422NVZ5_TRYRA|nr:uncharacterized protein TraAM80_02017 [Trypanosoma rangeli]RNF09662.1 hypothetical protein TraAM80_02017 [Trypanosoma rangeli]|eukprot:RNF09662.1 hypothetical protein TraAM80_02017 [Trypanosoma rangeli]